MAGDIGAVVEKQIGRLFVRDFSPQEGQQLIPFIDVVGEGHKLAPVPDGKYFEKAQEIVTELEGRDSVSYKTPKSPRTVKRKDERFPFAVTHFCMDNYNLWVIYEPTPQDTDQ